MTETPVLENDEATTENTEGNVSEVDTPTVAENVNKLAAFWTAVDAIDATNVNYDGATSEYDKLERGDKMKASHAVKAKVFDALSDDNFTLGKILSGLTKVLGTTSTGAADADPSEELVNRMAGIYLAYNELSKAHGELAERVKAAVEAVAGEKGDETIPALLAKRLVETKMGRKPREGSGTRHSPGKHIVQVFADLPDGTFLTIKQLSEAKSEEYGDDAASPVSIGQHLKSSFEQPGLSVVTEGEGDDTKVIGVRKGDAPEA